MASEESQAPAAEFEIIVSNLLSTFAPSLSDATNSRAPTAYPDDVFDKVAKYLVQAGKQQWSLRPRTYIVLRLINRLDSMPAFILDGLFDIAFPYTYNRLPASLSPGTRNAFLEQQSVVLSKAGDLEVEHGRHRHFPSTAESNFVVVKQLGSGFFGVVDHVRSKLSLEEYARKRTVRARTFSRDKKALKVFENELSNLKRLSHRHLVKYVGYVLAWALPRQPRR
jgi:serine/threonine protein kinase